jgi:3-oxoacyl-[acyl-carrier-protein] synthase III
MTATLRHSRITGTGSYLPERRLANADLAAELAARGVETSDEWIVERTGIRARHFAADDQNASDLALIACERALAAAGKRASDVDLIICATSTPDMVFPSTAAILQHKLALAELATASKTPQQANFEEKVQVAGDPSHFVATKSIAGCPAFDVQAVCSGFVYALTVADSMIKTGAAKCALVVGAEIFSRILDFNDRTTCVLFGDGAGAVVLEQSDTPGILATELHADGAHVGILCTPGTVNKGAISGTPLLHMDGQAVFKLAVGVLADVARSVLAKAGKTEADIDFLIPHQANIRIMQSTAKKLKLKDAQLVVTVDQHGNTSAASIPLALDAAVREGRIQPGHTLMLEGVGGGFTWGAVLLSF